MKHFLFLLFALPLVLVSCNPDEDDNELSGCMDPDAVNFSANATVDDGSCVYGESSGCGGASTVTYDGYTYDLVAIGDQCWFAENLRTTQYADGSSIPEVMGATAWSGLNDGARCAFNNDASNLATYGYLYNWYAVTDSRNVCPEGWHVPSDDEWMVMEQALGMTASAADSLGLRGVDQGHQLKSAFGWSPDAFDDGNGSNAAGFNALPGGIRYSYEFYGTAGSSGRWWSTTGSFQQARYRRMNYDQAGIWRDSSAPFNGFSVRCILD